MPRPTWLKTLALLGALTVLAACQSSEERAEAFYQNALALIAEGDTARATVEFRNVFRHNGFHIEAREAFADLLRNEGDVGQSYGQYLRLVEQVPDHIEARIALAEMALGFQNWDEARRHGARAIEIAPDDPATAILAVNLRYVDAVEAEDEVTRRAVFEEVMVLLQDDPDNALLKRMAVDGLVRDGDLEDALAIVERTVAAAPDDRQQQDIRLQILAQLERAPEMVAALEEMIVTFPADDALPAMLLRFHIARGEIAAAQEFLRDTAERAGEDQRTRHDALRALVQLKLEHDGTEAALAELDQIIADEGENGAIFQTLRAALNYDNGARDAAIGELEALLETELTPADAGHVRVALARILDAEREPDRARALIEQVIEDDPSQVEALKILAGWLIQEDNADLAISRLRTSLDASPDDPEALTLMAEAHARNGNRQLSREFLALAVEASGAAPAETLRYASVLLADDRPILAEQLVIDALRLAPGHPELLGFLGNIYLRLEDWPRAEQVERTLRAGDAGAVALADRLRTAILAGQGQTEAALTYLEELAGSGEDANINAQIAVVRARLVAGNSAEALDYAQDLLSQDPDNLALRLTVAAVHTASGAPAEAEEVYRALSQDQPQIQAAWIGLIRSLNAQGKADEAEAALNAALEALPQAPDLLWAQASFLEQIGDFEGAIAIYERLYERLPNAVVVANNLASLITTYRDDAESLDRAYAIARRLRGSDVAPFQDTYGWIAYRQGDYAEALDHLEPAAAVLVNDPLVQFHLGMTYLALERRQDALDQLRRAVQLAGDGDSRSQFVTARAEIAALEAALDPENTDAPAE